MDPEKYWSTTEVNKFLYRQIKTLCEAEGFVLSPRKGKHLVRIAEHFIQVVYPEVSRSRTRVHLLVSPAGSFANYFYAKKTLPALGNRKDDIYSSYLDLAAEGPGSCKQFYDIRQMKALWTEVIRPQLHQEVFSCLDAFGFDRFMLLSQTQRCDGFQYCSCPANDDALRFFAMGHGEIWKENLGKSIALLQQALDRFQRGMEQSRRFGHGVPVDDRENHDAALELLSMIQRGDGMTQVIGKMKIIEQTALNKAWGVALSPEGKTVRLKKKEQLQR